MKPASELLRDIADYMHQVSAGDGAVTISGEALEHMVATFSYCAQAVRQMEDDLRRLRAEQSQRRLLRAIDGRRRDDRGVHRHSRVMPFRPLPGGDDAA